MSPENSIQKHKPWPGYFIVRTTGEVVPLIAIDELPSGTDLVGVPRSIELEATTGMVNLGLQRSSGAFYQISRSREEDRITNPNSSSRPPLPATQLSAPRSLEHRPATPHPIARPATSTPAPGPRPHPRPTHIGSEQQQPCRHWCTHGICKWGQNCRYRHIMPMTLPGIHAVGLSDWPAWYRAVNPSFFAGERGRAVTRRPKTCAGDGCCARSTSNVRLAQKGAERLRSAVESRVGESVAKDEEVGGQETLIRLRSMQRDSVGRPASGKKSQVSRNTMLERAAVKDTKDWEEEGGSEVGLEEGVEKKRGAMAKEKLVDV